MELPIHWTGHAIQRAGERFGYDKRIIIPNRIIRKAALEVEEGTEYRVRRGKVTYVCKREANGVVIITVF